MHASFPVNPCLNPAQEIPDGSSVHVQFLASEPVLHVVPLCLSPYFLSAAITKYSRSKMLCKDEPWLLSQKKFDFMKARKILNIHKNSLDFH